MNVLENTLLENKLKKVQQELHEKAIFKNRSVSAKNEIPFAFVVYALERFSNNFNIDEIISDVTDGGNDNNIDILNIDDDFLYINVFQVKYKKSQNLNATIGEKDVTMFLTRVKEILIDSNVQNLVMNKHLENIYNDFHDLIKNSEKKPAIRLYLVTNGSDINEQEKQTLNQFCKDNPIVTEWKVLNNYSFFIEKTTKFSGNIEIIISDNIVIMNEEINSYIVNFKTIELVSLYEKFKDKILEKNVRKLLKTQINKNIEDSLINDPKMFWYKNNGLSIVCKRMEIKTLLGTKKLFIEDPYIINGGQTAKTIYNLFHEKENKDKDIFNCSYIMARIYQTTDEEKISSICYGTNNQNKITLFDLKSINSNLKKIKEFFDQQNISLLIQRNSEEKKHSLAINSDFLLQIYCAIFENIPHKSKISKSRIIEEYYDRIYNNECIHNELLTSFHLYNYIKNKNMQNAECGHLRHSIYAMLYIMTQKHPYLKKSFKETTAEKAYSEAITILEEITTQEKNKPDYSHHNFFKSENSITCINNYLKMNIDK
ncbi:MAG: AIPR family protein [Treponemataceae bacterium]